MNIQIFEESGSSGSRIRCYIRGLRFQYHGPAVRRVSGWHQDGPHEGGKTDCSSRIDSLGLADFGHSLISEHYFPR